MPSVLSVPQSLASLVVTSAYSPGAASLLQVIPFSNTSPTENKLAATIFALLHSHIGDAVAPLSLSNVGEGQQELSVNSVSPKILPIVSIVVLPV